MKFKNLLLPYLLLLTLVFFSVTNIEISQASFEQGIIEDPKDWIDSSIQNTFSEDFKSTLAFTYVDEVSETSITPFLSLKTSFNLPFNITGYLSKKIRQETGVFGVNINSLGGNITISFNGTIIINTPNTDPVFLSVEESEDSIAANFESIIGTNIIVPVSFNSLKLVTTDINVTEIEKIEIILAPHAFLEGNASLSATVNEQDLIWNTGEEIYFEDISLLKNESSYDTKIENVKLNFENMSLTLDSINTTIIVHTLLGSIEYDLLIDLTLVEFSEGQEQAGGFLVFLLDSLFNLENEEFKLSIEKASFSLISVLVLMVCFMSYSAIRRKKRKLS